MESLYGKRMIETESPLVWILPREAAEALCSAALLCTVTTCDATPIDCHARTGVQESTHQEQSQY